MFYIIIYISSWVALGRKMQSISLFEVVTDYAMKYKQLINLDIKIFKTEGS